MGTVKIRSSRDSATLHRPRQFFFFSGGPIPIFLPSHKISTQTSLTTSFGIGRRLLRDIDTKETPTQLFETRSNHQRYGASLDIMEL